MRAHRVQQGECLSSIARQHGFAWRSVYYHSDNADFRRKRPDPNVVYPNDVLILPHKEAKQVSRPTDQRHRFVKKSVCTWLRIVVRDEDDQPFASKRYELRVGFARHVGTTGPDGIIEHPIAADAENGFLELWLSEAPAEDSRKWELRIGHLDPASEITGVQARLNNLAFDCGPVDGILGPKTRAATRAFQKRFGLTTDGIPGRETKDRLKEAHGS
jgi:hypothetical protein